MGVHLVSVEKTVVVTVRIPRITARFFTLEALQEVQNRNWTSVSEFDVIAQ